MTQGAFSVSFINTGEDGYSNLKADRELIKISVTWGRISALSSVPAQIKLSDLQKVEKIPKRTREMTLKDGSGKFYEELAHKKYCALMRNTALIGICNSISLLNQRKCFPPS